MDTRKRFALAVCLVMLANSTAAVALPQGATPATNQIKAVPIQVWPGSGMRGKKYDLTIKPRDGDCATFSQGVTDKNKLVLVTPEGSGVDVIEPNSSSDPCVVVARISIEDGARIDNAVQLLVKDESKITHGGPVSFEVRAVDPGPIPPGLDPQVDMMWGLVPEKIVRDNFGHFISSKYYCIEIVIGNNSGYSLQISSVGFKMGGKDDPVTLPTNGYHMTRGTLEKGQQVGARALTVAMLSAVGTMLTGFTPLFHNLNHKTNYQTFTNIESSALTQAFGLAVPDTTIRELNQLDDQMLRDGFVVPNNTQKRSVVFIAKTEVLPYLTLDNTTGGNALRAAGTGSQESNSASPAHKNTECANPARTGCTQRTDLRQVEKALGSLYLVGDKIQYLNRVRVDSSPAAESTPPPTNLHLEYENKKALSAAAVTDSFQDIKITITGEHLDSAAILPPTGAVVDKLQVLQSTLSNDKNNRHLDATIRVFQGTKADKYPLVISTPGGTATVMFEVTAATP